MKETCPKCGKPGRVHIYKPGETPAGMTIHKQKLIVLPGLGTGSMVLESCYLSPEQADIIRRARSAP